MNWEDQLIQLYCHVCDLYRRELWAYCERFSQNAHPDFTDEEVMTIYRLGFWKSASKSRTFISIPDIVCLSGVPNFPPMAAIFTG